MKKYFFWSIICFLAFSIPTFAQECIGFNLKEGSGFEMNNFDAKGKPAGRLTYKISKITSEGASTVLTIEMESFSAKGKSELKNTYQMKCTGNTLLLDARSMISEEQLKSFKDMDMKFTYDNIEYPTKLTVGEKLKDASVKGEGKSGPMAMNFNMLIKNREVVAQEKLTIPAGSYDAYKLKSDMNMEMIMGFPVKMEMQTVSYRAPGLIWDLKTETYRKGKLMGYSELSKIY
jgi:hypothetical protein